ncbi:MAG: hypothetical protein R3E68_19765 [Burkholderiaceae bacterium]
MSTPVTVPERAILDAVDAALDTQFGLAELVRQPSLRGQEAPAQDLMARAYAAAGLGVDRWLMRTEDIATLPGFSPVMTPYDNAWNVVGTWQAPQPQGRSLILNGHIDVVPTGPASSEEIPRSSRSGAMAGCTVAAPAT